jgi:hypothetical protein
MDVGRAARMASEKLRHMNRQRIGIGVRLDILQGFLAAWQRLNDSLPHHPAQIDSLRPGLNRLCQDIGFGYKIVVQELVNGKAGFIEQRHLPRALSGAIHSLGLQLRSYYDAHKRQPRALWTELLGLFLYAVAQGHTQYQGRIPGAGQVSIEDSFKLIALIRLSDPYSSPAGLVTLLNGYFEQHLQLVTLHTAVAERQQDNGIALNIRQPHGNDNPSGSLSLDLSDLTKQLTLDLQKMQAGQQPSRLGLPTEVPTVMLQNTLLQLQRLWEKQLQRKNERENVHSIIELVNGLEAIYAALNLGRPFDPSLFLESTTDNHIDLGTLPSQTQATERTLPEPLRCQCYNRGNGGLALAFRGHESIPRKPQAGQLVAVRRPGAKASQGWVIGICRWLIETENSQGFDLGLQYLTRQPCAVVIKIIATGGQSGSFQPAIAARQQRGGKPVHTLISVAGQLQEGDLAYLYERAQPQTIRCLERLESGAGFDRHLYEMA